MMEDKNDKIHVIVICSDNVNITMKAFREEQRKNTRKAEQVCCLTDITRYKKNITLNYQGKGKGGKSTSWLVTTLFLVGNEHKIFKK